MIITKNDLTNKKKEIEDFFASSMNDCVWTGLNNTLKDLENIFNSNFNITHIEIVVEDGYHSIENPKGIFILKDQNGIEVGRIKKPL